MTRGQNVIRNIVGDIDYDIYKDLYVHDEPEDGDYSLYQTLEAWAVVIDELYESQDRLESLKNNISDALDQR